MISTTYLSVSYGEHCALRDVRLSITQGEFVAVVGISGCGKSTLLHALADFIPYHGEIEMQGKVSVVSQQHSVFSWLTVRDNIAFGLSAKGEQRERIIAEHLKLAGLEEKEECYPGELSGGQIQRVALAQALAANPDVLLMDEPYGALDAWTRGKMQEWLLTVWDSNKKTIVLVTHDIEEAIFLADRVVVLGGGRITDGFAIPFGRPRYENLKFTPEFSDLRRRVFESLRG